MSLLACSGPHALEHIQSNITISLVISGAALIIAAAAGMRFAISRQRLKRFISVVLLATLNPGWWLSAYAGDCGSTRLLASAIATAACAWLALGI